LIGTHNDAIKSLLFSQSYSACPSLCNFNSSHNDFLSTFFLFVVDLVVSGSWDRNFKTWDPRAPTDTGAAAIVECPGKVYALALCGSDTLVVGTSERHVHIFDMRKLGHGGRSSDSTLQRRESSLKHPTRVIRAFPDGSGFATGSTEGRIAIDFIDPNPAIQAGKYAFKCHRAKQPSGEDKVFPVHAIAFHPTFGTFASGGGDGLVNVWDWVAKKRLTQLPAYSTSVSALAFSSDGSQLAVAASYAYETGEQAHPADAIFVRPVSDSDVRPKASLK
jgi:cell cycle arrest protein BUB3